jgi:hypothetical protein
MQPQKPMAPEGTAGRAFDYPVGYNLNYGPRSYEPVSFADLHALADNCDLLRLVIETRKDQICAQDWDVRPRKQADGTHPKASSFASEIAAAKSFFEFPDKEHLLSSWLRQIAEELFVTDAVSIYVRPDRKGRVHVLPVPDSPVMRMGDSPRSADSSSRLMPRIDGNGRTPAPPDVAYQQILHGVPAGDFSRDELFYLPRNKRPGHVYGYSPVEQVIVTANTLVRRSLHQLAYYTDGNIVDAMFTAPTGFTVDQIEGLQRWWDAQCEGSIPGRRHGLWLPSGVDIKQPKQMNLSDPYDELLARIICFAFSISPQPFVSMMNRATAESAHDAAVEEGLMPVLNYFRDLFHTLFDRMGWHDIEMVPVDDRETDPKTADDIDVADVKAGIRTINEVRTARGLAPMPGGDKLMLAGAAGYVPIQS